MAKYKLPLIEVAWHDASTTHGWETHEEVDVEPDIMITVGFLVSRTDNLIIVASSLDKETESQSNARIKIPLGMIKTIKELNISYKKEKKVEDKDAKNTIQRGI